MTDSAWLFLYTPVPYLAAMYAVAYRHDITRLAKPLHDGASAHEWWSVCGHLGLVGAEAEPPQRPFLGGTRNLLLIVSSLVIYAIPGLIPLPWYYLCAVQAAVAVPLFILLILNWTGPFPFKPYRDVLPYPRLGTRARDLRRRNEQEPKASEVPDAGVPP